MKQMIDADSASREKSEVVRYNYKGETVILVDQCRNCPDGAVVVYNCRGEQTCIFGTIAGLNTCPDFFSVAVKQEVIWSK